MLSLEDLRSSYARALRSYLAGRTDLPTAQSAVALALAETGAQDVARLAALHHQALAALLEAGDLAPETLVRAGDFLAALQADQRPALERAAPIEDWRALLDQLPLPVWLLDPRSATLRYGNSAALRLYGYTADEWNGLDARRLAASDALEAWQAYLNDICLQRLPQSQVKPEFWRHQAKDGASIAIYLSLTRLQLGSDKLCLALVEDMFGQQRREENFQRMQKLEAIGQLTSGVAHNFNNILSVIQGYAEMIGSRSSQLDTRLAKQRSAILAAAKRGAELVRQLMIFSRKSDAVILVQDINPIVAETALLAERLLSARVTFVKRLHAEPLYAAVDAGQLSQAILNLAVNARDVMPEGGSLTIATSRAQLAQDGLQPALGRTRAYAAPPAPGDYALITVADTGIGMSQETRNRIFEPFFSTKPVGKGTGLGLSLTYGCITEFGGFIEVESALGLGTTFFLFLPIAETDPAQLPKPRHAWRPSGRYADLTALVVEDEPDLLELMCEWLTDAGFTVLAAQTAEEALQHIVAQDGKPIHLLIADEIVPEGGGQRVLEHMRKEYSSCRLIVISGSFGANERVAGLSEGVTFLSKPFSENELLHAIKEALVAQSN